MTITDSFKYTLDGWTCAQLKLEVSVVEDGERIFLVSSTAVTQISPWLCALTALIPVPRALQLAVTPDVCFLL